MRRKLPLVDDFSVDFSIYPSVTRGHWPLRRATTSRWLHGHSGRILLVRMQPRFAVAIREDEFLNPFSCFDFARIEISLRIHGDGIDPVKIAGHAAVIADGTFQL